MSKKIDISKLKIKFGGKNAPKDKELIKLLKLADKGKLLVRRALIKTEGIKPFSDFKPQTAKAYRDYFENCEKENFPPPLYVYPKGDYFIMSDDYNSFFLYLEKGYHKIMCILLGDSDSKFMVEKSEPFQLPALKIQILKSK
ncbi:hypothetical protein ACFLZ1_01205 [Patescibacteria group bacterium]